MGIIPSTALRSLERRYVESRIYTGTVAHSRKGEHPNRFEYGVYYVFVNIDELDSLGGTFKRFGHNHGLFSVRDRDHGPRDGSPLRPWIDSLLGRAGIDLEGGRVFLLTFPRVLGFGFYPVSFWYCYHADGSIRAVLAEVRNTIGGHHNYLLHQGGAPFDFTKRPEVTKVFYVSPFIPMDARYEFRLSEPGETAGVAIHDFVEGPLLLVASLRLKAQELTDKNLMRLLFRFGPMSLRAWVLIHLQALRIVSKGIRYIAPPPGQPAEETSL